MKPKMNAGKLNIKVATPIVGIEGINKAILALWAYKKPAFYKDLAIAAGLNAVYMSQCLSSSRDLGLTMLAGRRGLYQLTKDGEEYARLLSSGKISESRDFIRDIILKNPLWSEIISFLRVCKGKPRDPIDLVLHVERKLGKKWSQSMRDRLSKVYVSILEYARFIKVEKDKIISLIDIERKEEELEEVPEREVKEPSRMPISIKNYNYFELKIPESFIIYVRKKEDAIAFFESQIKEDSMLAPWIQFIKNLLKHEKESASEIPKNKSDK